MCVSGLKYPTEMWYVGGNDDGITARIKLLRGIKKLKLERKFLV